MKLNARKITISSLVAVCFWVAFERLHQTYMQNIPIGFVGDCFSIKYPQLDGRFQIKILTNDNEDRSSSIAISDISKGHNEAWVERYKYSQLRMLDPKKMECQ